MRALRPILTVVGLLAAWQLAVWVTGVPRFLLPPPGAVLAMLTERFGLLMHHAAITATETLLGMAIGTMVGAVFAILLAARAEVRRWLLPLIVISQALPVFALAPLLVLWLGYGMASKVAMAVLIIFFPVTAAFFDGLKRTEPGWLELARTMDAPRSGRAPADPRAGCPAGLRLGAARGGGGSTHRGRGRRVGRLQRRPRLSHAAGQCAHAGRRDVCGPSDPRRDGAGPLVWSGRGLAAPDPLAAGRAA